MQKFINCTKANNKHHLKLKPNTDNELFNKEGATCQQVKNTRKYFEYILEKQQSTNNNTKVSPTVSEKETFLVAAL